MSPSGVSHPVRHSATSAQSNSTEKSAPSDRIRRHFLVAATATVGVVGAGLAAWPFIAAWRPSGKARALGSPVQLKVNRIEPGRQVTVTWRGQPVWVLHRTPQMLERMSDKQWLQKLRDPDSTVETQQPAYARNATRSLRPELLVAVGLCTHLGCVPKFRPEVASKDLGPDWPGDYYCPCHGSRFDLAGRVTKSVPAPTNLVVPPHRYLDPDTVEIGVDDA